MEFVPIESIFEDLIKYDLLQLKLKVTKKNSIDSMNNTVVDLASSTILAEQSDLSICILFAPNDLSRKRSKKLESFHVSLDHQTITTIKIQTMH